MIRGSTPTLRGCKVGFSSPKTVPTQDKGKNPHKKWAAHIMVA
jgi:hypothetical protein